MDAESPTTEELAAEAKAWETEGERGLPEKLARLRQKLGQKAKQGASGDTDPPKGVTLYAHLEQLGLVYL